MPPRHREGYTTPDGRIWLGYRFYYLRKSDAKGVAEFTNKWGSREVTVKKLVKNGITVYDVVEKKKTIRKHLAKHRTR